MHHQESFASFICGQENWSALAAIRNLAADLVNGNESSAPFLYLHGPAGTGKSHLVQALLREVACEESSLTANIWDAAALDGDSAAGILDEARDCDVVVLEDVQHLRPIWVEPLIHWIDDRLGRSQATVVTAQTGPQHLRFRGERYSNRLTSRLAAGLVISLESLQPASRLRLLEQWAARQQLFLSSDVLSWLANNLNGGGRQLLGAVNQLKLLSRLHDQPLEVPTVAAHWQEQVDAARPTVERIAWRVSGYFRVPCRQLQSRRRYRNIQLPRQVGMYLARRLTGLSLEQIGAYFGGRDHSTVLYACRKVQEAIGEDAGLCGAVRQLHAELA